MYVASGKKRGKNKAVGMRKKNTKLKKKWQFFVYVTKVLNHCESLLIFRNYQLQKFLEAANDTDFIKVYKLRKTMSYKKGLFAPPNLTHSTPQSITLIF